MRKLKVTLVVPPEFDKFVEKHDVTEKYELDTNSKWVKWEHSLEELYFDGDSNPHLYISFPDRQRVGPDIFIEIPFGELMEHFMRFKFFESLEEYVLGKKNYIVQNQEVWQRIKKALLEQAKEEAKNDKV